MCAWLIPAALVVGAPALKDRRPADAEIKARLVGYWDRGPPGGREALEIEFRADGTWAAAQTNRGEARTSVVATARGTWSVRDGRLVLTGGLAGRHEVVSVTRGELRWKTEKGVVRDWTRRP